MAYNYFPQTYQYNPYQGFQQPTQQYQQQTTQPQIQNGGFVSVRNIEEAYNWPVAPGNSITFKDENSPYIYTKTKGFSQLEAPIFERFRLVKEDDTPKQQENCPESPEKAENSFQAEEQINSIWKEIEVLKSQIKAIEAKPKRKEKIADEQPDE